MQVSNSYLVKHFFFTSLNDSLSVKAAIFHNKTSLIYWLQCACHLPIMHWVNQVSITSKFLFCFKFVTDCLKIIWVMPFFAGMKQTWELFFFFLRLLEKLSFSGYQHIKGFMILPNAFVLSAINSRVQTEMCQKWQVVRGVVLVGKTVNLLEFIFPHQG